MHKLNKAIFLVTGAALAGIAVNTSAEPSALSPFQSNDPPIQAAAISSNGLTLDAHESGIWKDDAGSGFRKGVTEIGFSVGGGLGSSIFGSVEAHDLALAKLCFGKVLSDVVAGDNWYSGNWEGVGEVFGGAQFNPREAYVIGLTPVLRYNFATGTRWVPFFDAGAGVTLTDIGRPDLGGVFQFNLQTGPGVHWFFRKDTVLTLQYRFMHISNASIQDPDHGVNTSVFYVGVSRFF